MIMIITTSPQNVETTNVLDEINNLQLKITSQTKTLQN